MSDANVSVVCRFPPSVYRALQRVADRHEKQAHHVVETIVIKALHTGLSPRFEVTRTHLDEEITILHAQGKNDLEISRMLHVSHSWVNKRRRELGLPRNSTGGRRRKEPTT